MEPKCSQTEVLLPNGCTDNIPNPTAYPTLSVFRLGFIAYIIRRFTSHDQVLQKTNNATRLFDVAHNHFQHIAFAIYSSSPTSHNQQFFRDAF